jgi:mono/diheme cytochrome c family protein
MKRYSIPVGLLLLVSLSGVRAWAHGSEHHHEGAEMKAHMEQMVQLKQQIPEEYRIMNRTPVAPDEQSLQHGKELFDRFCVACHGKEGHGDGPAAMAMDPKPADFHDLDHSAIYGPGEKYWIIGNGSGATGMPGFAREASPKDRWDLVNHLYLLQRQEN